MKVNYDEQTYNSKNILARYSHRIRFKFVINVIRNIIPKNGKLLDYGCGDGFLIKKLGFYKINAVGYDPFYIEKFSPQKISTDVYSDINKLNNKEKYDLITIFEVIEHMNDKELIDFFQFSKNYLKDDGLILASVPIMIGPALIFKELRRMSLHKRKSDHNFIELFLASIFAFPPIRSKTIATSHKGYDFRKTLKFIRQKYGKIGHIKYLPLKIGTWYGNSQIFFSIRFYQNSNNNT